MRSSLCIVQRCLSLSKQRLWTRCSLFSQASLVQRSRLAAVRALWQSPRGLENYRPGTDHNISNGLSKTLSLSGQPERSVNEPLRVLFFGSDDFSIESLKAIHESREQLNVKSIDVVCRPPKRTGRGLKEVSEVPLAKVARSLSLPVHEVDTFGDWQAPVFDDGPVNLLVAVSFGLLIPGRLITAAKYGGINVHPSKLPDLRGAAPLHHTLLQRKQSTAITIQTLHPSKFDRGVVISQTDLAIPEKIQSSLSVAGLRSWLAPIAGKALSHALWNGDFIPPVKNIGVESSNGTVFPNGIRPAPKINKEDSHIDWQTWSSSEILCRLKILGNLWNKVEITAPFKNSENEGNTAVKTFRVVFKDIQSRHSTSLSDEPGLSKEHLRDPKPAGTIEVITHENKDHLCLWTNDREFVVINELTAEGQPGTREPVLEIGRWGAGKFEDWPNTITLK